MGALTFPYQYKNNADNTLTITNYTGSGGIVSIPSTINGKTVTGIGVMAFYNSTNITDVIIPYSITNMSIIAGAVTNIVVDSSNSVYSSIDGILFNKDQTVLVFIPYGKAGSYTIPDGVTRIGNDAIAGNYLTSITIPSSVTDAGNGQFDYCWNLTALYFKGNAPKYGSYMIMGDENLIIYYLPGATGWGSTWASYNTPTALWLPNICGTINTDNCNLPNQIGFNIKWAKGMSYIVEACTNLTTSWYPIQTNIMSADTDSFSDPNWTNNPCCFYRIKWNSQN
jgi:hypothetical protein